MTSDKNKSEQLAPSLAQASAPVLKNVPHTTPPHSLTTPLWSTQMSFVFGLCALLGILLLIFSEVGMAQTNRGGGFRPGGPPIGNPMNDPYGDDEDFEEDEGDFEDEEEIMPIPSQTRNNPPPINNPSSNQDNSRGGISIGGESKSEGGPDIHRTKKGYDLEGAGIEKGIKSKNKIDALAVDSESGDGVPANRELITDFNFPNADILDLAKTLGRLTGKNFIFDKDVKGPVSIISNAPITVSDAWRAFLTALDMNAFAIVPTGKFLRIMRQNDAKGKNVRLYSKTAAPNTDALITKIFKIKYISAKELENVIRTYASMGARIYGYEQTNTLIITDTGSTIDKVAKMITFLDVEGFDAGIEVIPVKHASAVELQKLVDTLLPGTPASFPGRPGFPGGGFGGGGGGSHGNFGARRTKEGGIVNTIIADERTNTMIVHANTKGFQQVKALVNRLDRKLPAISAGGGKVHVMYLQFADAEEMAKTLSNFSQNSGSSSPSGGGRSGGGFGGPGGNLGGIGVNPVDNNLFEGQIKISADKATNSLVITASPADYATIQRVIHKLDIPRDQIYVEVIIMEVQTNRANEFAANILLPGGTSVAPTKDLINLITNPANIPQGLVLHKSIGPMTDMSIPGASGGAASTIKVPSLAFLLRAFQQYSGANILATPQLMTMDNEEATFESTDKVPIAQINNLGLGNVTKTYTYLEVPLSLKIKPQLNKISNFIRMHITAKISDFTNRSATEDAQATLTRNADTTVMVADSDTVVLGGLMRDKSEEVINKVPLLGDIPILGWLFKSRTAKIQKSNLLLFITPKILRQPEAVRMVLDKKLKERDEFIEKEMGGEDNSRNQRNSMIRGLPDVKSIKGYNTKRDFNLDEEPTNKENAETQVMNEIREGKRSAKPATSEAFVPDSLPAEDDANTLTLPAIENEPGSGTMPNPDPFATPAKRE